MFLRIVLIVLTSLATVKHAMDYCKLKRKNQDLEYWNDLLNEDLAALDDKCSALTRANARLQARFDNMVNLRDEISHDYNTLVTRVNGGAENTDCPIPGPM